jgi:hypothetical protein
MTLKVDPTKIRLLRALKDGITDTKHLREIVGIKEWQFNALVKDLIDEEYIDKKAASTITLRKNAKVILFRDIANKFDIEKLLHHSNETVLLNITKPITIDNLQQTTKLSLRSIQRSISELESLGVIQRDTSNKTIIRINQDYELLFRFADLLKRENESKNIEPYSEIIYKDSLRILKRVPKGKAADGELTGFSLFSDYGIEYITTHDYYIKQEAPINLQDILLHSILAANKDKDKNGMAIAILFYLKNRDKMDLLGIRTLARSFRISDIWIDIEGYVRNNEVKHPDLFLPHKEFEEKATLYNIPPEYYTLPKAYPDLFRELGRNLENEAEAYLFGGENMRIKGLKPATKDCDIATTDPSSYEAVVDALKKMGYTSSNSSRIPQDDKRIQPSDMLEHTTSRSSRVDIFNLEIAGKLFLSPRMKARAKIENYGKLELGILRNEDVFLLKGVTLREGDIHDMAALARSPGFEWKVVFDELQAQEDDLKSDFSFVFLDSLDDLNEQTGIRPPFYKKLLSLVLTNTINKEVRKGTISLKDLITSLQGGDITEKTIRNKVDYLERKRFLRKDNVQGEVVLRRGKKNVLNVPSIDKLDVQARVEESIQTIHKKLYLPDNVKKQAKDIAKNLITERSALQGRRANVIAAGIFDWLNRRGVIFRGVGEIERAGKVSGYTLLSIRKDLNKLLPPQPPPI